MGNCAHKEEYIDEQKLQPNINKKNDIAVLTFAGPNAFDAPSNESFQTTFSDPVFFSSMNNQKSLSFN